VTVKRKLALYLRHSLAKSPQPPLCQREGVKKLYKKFLT
jgi:hypothetical protein